VYNRLNSTSSHDIPGSGPPGSCFLTPPEYLTP
jgi:hypothetical protein